MDGDWGVRKSEVLRRGDSDFEAVCPRVVVNTAGEVLMKKCLLHGFHRPIYLFGREAGNS